MTENIAMYGHRGAMGLTVSFEVGPTMVRSPFGESVIRKMLS